jgi:hypothetical protein
MFGFGKYIWANGESYDGGWHEGKRYGSGVDRHADGTVVTGYWIQDLNIGPKRDLLAYLKAAGDGVYKELEPGRYLWVGDVEASPCRFEELKSDSYTATATVVVTPGYAKTNPSIIPLNADATSMVISSVGCWKLGDSESIQITTFKKIATNSKVKDISLTDNPLNGFWTHLSPFK